MKQRVDLLAIDFQKDFCDGPSNVPGAYEGTLCVPGAYEDAERFYDMVKRINRRITNMFLTMDSHNRLHIANPDYWVDSSGQHPDPFTCITVADVEAGKWMATIPSERSHALAYLKALDTNKRYPHVIWPVHCRIGFPGHAFTEPVAKAIDLFEDRPSIATCITKGSNYRTEHFSAVQADVPDPNDPSTMLQTGQGSLIHSLLQADLILLCGQALSHCVANTVTDIADNFGDDNIKKLVLLEDLCSNVPGFENLGQDFVTNMIKRGMQVKKSTEIFI